jgi:hypothetical protein
MRGGPACGDSAGGLGDPGEQVFERGEFGLGELTDQLGVEFGDVGVPLATGAPTGIDRLITFGGGIPITTDGHLIGGIGVSGGHWTDDMKIAEAGLTALHQVPSQAG